MPAKRDLVVTPVAEGALILVLGAIGWAASWPFVFASLGPTAYEMIEKPESKSAKPYNVIAGHFVGLGAGFFSVWVLGTWAAPKVTAAGLVAEPRIWTSVLAVALTAGITLMIGASQPASLSTTLLVALGAMQTGRDALAIIIGVLILATIGEPVRRVREKRPTSPERLPRQIESHPPLA
ncbi:MAG: HPP family protein [Terriglobia bacterium]